MLPLNGRREAFAKALVAALVPFLGVVSPAVAASTPYTTNANTGSSKQQGTPKGTTGVTTPNDNDMQTDTTIDSVNDTRADPTQDSRNDL